MKIDEKCLISMKDLQELKYKLKRTAARKHGARRARKHGAKEEGIDEWETSSEWETEIF